jgi:hypothetical protein
MMPVELLAVLIKLQGEMRITKSYRPGT